MSLHRVFERIWAAAIGLALIAALGVPAFAAPEQNGAPVCSATLTVADMDQCQDLANAKMTVDVWQVASLDQAGGRFALTDAFASLEENALWNGGVLTADTAMQDLQEAVLAVLTARTAENETEDEAGEDEPVLPAGDDTVETTVGGTVPFPKGMGLYLLAPRTVETIYRAYTFSPILLAVPSADREGGQWVYASELTMKPEWESRLTELVIEKTLRQYNATLGPTTFLFAVEGVLDGEVVYSNIVPLTFSGAGTLSVTVSGIPAGATVTVTEVYSGASYDAADGRVSVTVEDLPIPQEGADPQRVAFTNDYNDRRVPDSAVTNTFVYDGTGWKWQSGSKEAEG